MKPRELLHLLDTPEAPRPAQRGEQMEILLTLVVHMFFADKRLDEREIQLLSRILPAGEEVQPFIDQLAARELDLDRLGELFPDMDDRDDIITLAEHAVWGDDEVDPREWDFVDRLVEKLGVQRD